MFDASSIIHAWDNYPHDKFPPLWEWMETQIRSSEFTLSQTAYEEVDFKFPDCGKWLKKAGIKREQLSNDILQEAQAIKSLLGITDDNYHAKGVGENDLLIIATAKVNGCPLVTEEKQFNLPKILAKYKIPAVCELDGVNVKSVQFIDLIKASDEVF